MDKAVVIAGMDVIGWSCILDYSSAKIVGGVCGVWRVIFVEMYMGV